MNEVDERATPAPEPGGTESAAVEQDATVSAPSSGPFALTVSDVRQYLYCPRIVYWTYVQPVEKPTWYKMERGKASHTEEARKEARRALSRYGFREGRREFDVWLRSEALGLSGRLDLAVWDQTGGVARVYPVEFKHTWHDPGVHWRYQLLCYAVLLEERYRTLVPRGFFYLIPRRQLVPVDFTPTARLHLRRLLSMIRRMLVEQRIPDLTRRLERCRDCEYRNYCWS